LFIKVVYKRQQLHASNAYNPVKAVENYSPHT